MPLTEAEITYLEEQIPELALLAFKQAYWQTLAAGLSVVEAENGVLYETFPDGTRRVLAQLTPPFPVARGTKVELR